MCTNMDMKRKKAKIAGAVTMLLRKAIAGSGVTFLGLEQKTGVSRQSLMEFARGKRFPRLDMADRLVKFFRV